MYLIYFYDTESLIELNKFIYINVNLFEIIQNENFSFAFTILIFNYL